jgi:hypothetical protein
LQNVDKLAEVTVVICNFLLEFFVQDKPKDKTTVMRPLTNSNFVIDFHRYNEARYYAVVVEYLQGRQFRVPDYDLQYQSHAVLSWAEDAPQV